ncbi:hypothetical protein [Oscillatoria salina]|nr:hypothetical protein [Oscillatoria salina]MBZ8182060.1 hypothetical protein [Oscillatoria salina IIICB1]NET87283.1 hypothetical protein [Kamptonema sp. SIO1D9]
MKPGVVNSDAKFRFGRYHPRTTILSDRITRDRQEKHLGLITTELPQG